MLPRLRVRITVLQSKFKLPIGYVSSCRPYVRLLISSASLLGRRNVTCVTQPGLLSTGAQINSNGQQPGWATKGTSKQPNRTADDDKRFPKGSQGPT